MKAIIIQDHDARALLDQLELAAMRRPDVVVPGMTPEKQTEFLKLYGSWLDSAYKDMHGTFHYRVCRWLQEQGADVLRR